MYKIIICDDDLNQLTYIKQYIQNLDLSFDYEISTFSNIKTMIESCENDNHNYIFLLDIVFHKKDQGIMGATYINKKFKNSIIIYISAYLEKVCDVYETEHCYFIYKPQMEDRIKNALEKAVRIYNNHLESIYIQVGKDVFDVKLKEIYYIERIKRYSVIHIYQKTIKTHMNLDELMQRLTKKFIQCHKSIVVNLDQIEQKNRKYFVMKNKEIIPISRSYEKKVHELFQKYLMEV